MKKDHGAKGIVPLHQHTVKLQAVMAADKAVNQDVKGGKTQVRFSYTTRLIAMFAVLFAFAKSGVADPLASVLPLAFVRPVITVAEFFRKK